MNLAVKASKILVLKKSLSDFEDVCPVIRVPSVSRSAVAVMLLASVSFAPVVEEWVAVRLQSSVS